MDVLNSFHPATARWFRTQFREPTRPQASGWPHIMAGRHTLISAPTGSGKTLAAFLAALDRLFRAAAEGRLGAQTKVLYVSPLRALSNDINRNLAEPLAGIGRAFESLGLAVPEIRTSVRSGDTSQSERRAMLKNHPHIIVTTPESLYLLLTAESGRKMLSSVETVIVDEIHALADSRRGTHLTLSLERLDALVCKPIQRIGLSATQNPMSLVAHFLVGTKYRTAAGTPDCVIVDEGHYRRADLNLEVPDSPLEAVMSHEVWAEIYKRLAALVEDHHTTLIFVNTRRLAERVTFHLSSLLGEDRVASHHGSLSAKRRMSAEARLKAGDLKAIVATASLELGIDIGYVDLVCQLGSPRSVATFLQRVGRSGHYYGGVPKGLLFPLTRDELVESAALLRAVKRGALDKLCIPEAPLDVMSQQMVAEVACHDFDESELFNLVRGAYPYRNLEERHFKDVLHMLADGITTKRGRRGAHIFYDGVNRKIKARKGARLAAVTSGGAIPDQADYKVTLQPSGTFIGTVDEDFAVESSPGDVFQLGNTSWKILKIERGNVMVEDAHGAPPSIPFWFGEAPGRTRELSSAVAALRADVEALLKEDERDRQPEDMDLDPAAYRQLFQYLAAGKKSLSALPTQDHVIAERFFDESGGMQLVIHSPFGTAINRAWGLALRKRFCRSFNFELQAAANDNAIVLSLGPKHSFPLEDVFRFLNPETARDILIQAVLDVPLFQVRWRWVVSRSLAMLRTRGGKRVAPQIQRMEAEDLVAVVFPDQLACLENIAGEREIPDHPLVTQTLNDCLQEAMDADGFLELLTRIHDGSLTYSSVDNPEPSLLAHEILTAKPYAFLDDAPLEERRTQAVHLRRTLGEDQAREAGRLDQAAIELVREQVAPSAENRDEAHESLIQAGCFSESYLNRLPSSWRLWLEELVAEGRAALFSFSVGGTDRSRWIAVERLPYWRTLFPEGVDNPSLRLPEREAALSLDPGEAMIDLIRGYMEVSGPATALEVAEHFAMDQAQIQATLEALEGEGMVMRGYFDTGVTELQWCNRRLLARIHHLTLQRLRSEIQAVSLQDYMLFLCRWQYLTADHHLRDLGGLFEVVRLLEGFETAAGCWEADLLPARTALYRSSDLDQLCMSGQVGWGRFSSPSGQKRKYHAGPLKNTPMSLFLRENTELWLEPGASEREASGYAGVVLDVLRGRGACFFNEIRDASGLLPTQVEQALGELAALGMVTSDSFSGLRGLLKPASKKQVPARYRGAAAALSGGLSFAGRWSLLADPVRATQVDDDEAVTYMARVYLRRYGVVFRKLLLREYRTPMWRDLLRVYRRLEAVGEIRGGYFVQGCAGEQFALPEAVTALRKARRSERKGQIILISGGDPLNLTGVLLPGPLVARMPGNRLALRDGEPVAGLDRGKPVLFPVEEPLTEQQLAALWQTRKPDLNLPRRYLS